MYKGKAFFRAKYWKFALVFNIPLIPHYLSMTLLNQLDRIMIARMIGSSEAAIYSVAYTVAMMMNIITNAINHSFIPYTYKSIKENNYSGIRINSNFLLVLVGGVCLIAMAFGPEVIKLFATDEYYDAIWVIPPVAASVYFMFLYPLFANIEFYFEKTKLIMVASCLGSITNIILNYIFIDIFGYYAAGYTTLICYILFAFAHYVFYKKILKENIPELSNMYDIKFVLSFSVFVIIAMIAMTMTYKHIIIRYTTVLLLFIIIVSNRRRIVESIKTLKR